jgi:hypothetical protein
MYVRTDGQAKGPVVAILQTHATSLGTESAARGPTDSELCSAACIST